MYELGEAEKWSHSSNMFRRSDGQEPSGSVKKACDITVRATVAITHHLTNPFFLGGIYHQLQQTTKKKLADSDLIGSNCMFIVGPKWPFLLRRNRETVN